MSLILIGGGQNRAWSCWWQGEENAPDIVKACWNSQRKNLPEDMELVIITEENYDQYISLPEIILQKVENDGISFVHLSDIIRAILLYKYGGLWLDSTLFVSSPIPEEIFLYTFYTRNMPETQYCTKAMWANWFMYTIPGSKLFQFVWEAFYYYLTRYDTITYYFTLDYFIAIACNLFPEVEKQFHQVPFNNEGGFELGKHLKEKFEPEKYNEYTGKSWIHKVTYKIRWREGEKKEESVYGYIILQNQ